VMHLTGGSWTIGTGNYDGINYGLFYSDRMMERIVRNVVAEVRRLKGHKVLVGECGHATRSAKEGIPMFCGGKDALPVINCLEFAWQAYQVIASKEAELRNAPQEASLVTIASLAVQPQEPVSRGMVQNTLIAAILGAFIGVAIVLGMTWWREFNQPTTMDPSYEKENTIE